MLIHVSERGSWTSMLSEGLTVECESWAAIGWSHRFCDWLGLNMDVSIACMASCNAFWDHMTQFYRRPPTVPCSSSGDRHIASGWGCARRPWKRLGELQVNSGRGAPEPHVGLAAFVIISPKTGCPLLSGEPDYFGRKKISSGGDLSHYSCASLY